MKESDRQQLTIIIHNMTKSLSHFPYFHDIENDQMLGPLISSLDDTGKAEIKQLLADVLADSINSLKTKGGQYFARFFQSRPDDFWTFRELNSSKSHADLPEFQALGKTIEQEMFRLESLLTQTMLNRPEGLGKVIDAFYTIVYRYFPLYNLIKDE